jgi:polysaccharide export outer membrane protein
MHRTHSTPTSDTGRALSGRRAWPLAPALATAACGASGQYVWVDHVPETAFTFREGNQYVVAVGDLLNVRVYAQDAITVHARVRTDGKLTIPLVGDVDVVGKTTDVLSRLIAARLRDYVKDPSVSVTVDEIAPISVTVVGEVLKPGVITLERRSGVIQALAVAGGTTDFASKNRLRNSTSTSPARIRFSYDSLARGEGRGPQFGLQGGDVIVVE